jgi:hypothetical protein
MGCWFGSSLIAILSCLKFCLDAVASEPCRETQCTTEAFGMHFIPYAEKKVSLACTKDWEQHYL